ncbi:MAG: phosphatase PAP2 family protein [Alphaproteobacteria bacterium]|nr:phosphatase PAP2 family protein [Alphaproteobacteria bacterium]
MENFLDHLASVLLVFSNPVTVFSLFLLGFFYYDKTTWGVAILLACFSMVLNPALKAFFGLPRPMDLPGFGFPSGHFQGSMCFYGWLFTRIPKTWVRIALTGILAATGFALVQKGYHYPRDIAGAFISGSLVVILAHVMLAREKYKQTPQALGYFLILLSAAPLLYLIYQDRIPKHTILGLSLLCAITWLWNRRKTLV